MKEYAHDIMLQEQGCSALAVILKEKIDEDLSAFLNDEGLATILRAMMQSPSNIEMQKQGLKILNSLKTKDNYELMLSAGGLDVIISNMNSFDYQVDISVLCCEILKNFTRMSLDFQRAVSAKGKIQRRICNFCGYLFWFLNSNFS